MKQNKIILILVGLLLVLLIVGGIFLHFHKKDDLVPTKEELKPTEYKRVKLEDASEIVNYGSCTSTNEDEVCFLVINKSYLTLRNAKVTKEGDSTNIEETLNNGLNSTILVTYGSSGIVENSVIETSAKGAPAFFVNGRKAHGDLKDTTISTLGTASPGLVASATGTINTNHITINTKVKDSPGVLVNKGRIELISSMIETNGSGSPVISSSDEVYIKESTGTANGSRIAILKNNANVVIDNSSMLVSGGSNEKYSESAVLIYGDKREEKSVFQSINSSLNINKNLPYYNLAPFFIVDNINSEIDLENTAFNFGSNKLIKATNSDITMNLKNQVIYGEIELANSKLQLNMIANSSYTGTINNQEASIYLSKDSEINLTNNMYIKELKNDDPSNNNITLNGYHLYVNNELIK